MERANINIKDNFKINININIMINVDPYTRVCMHIQVLIFFDFSSFLVWKRLQHVWPQKNSPSAQEK